MSIFSWIKTNEHAVISVVAVTGTVLATTAAYTTHLLPVGVTAWIAAAGSIIGTVLGHVIIPPVAKKMNARFL